jgi:predicted membrane-bound spermidine synthase
VAALALAIVIAAKTGMVKECTVDSRKTGIRDLGGWIEETRAVISGSVLVMTVRTPG